MAKDRKEEILATAYEIVGEEGIESLHARSIAARIGINHAAVHYYFPKRSDLVAALAAYALKRFANDQEKLMGHATTPVGRIEAHLAQAEVYCKEKSRFLKNWASLFVAAVADDAVRKELSKHLKDWTKAVGKDLEAGGREVKKTSPFSNPELLVATLLGLLFYCHTVTGKFDAAEKLDLIAGSLLG